jgi:DNA-binding NtrC family response regulator
MQTSLASPIRLNESGDTLPLMAGGVSLRTSTPDLMDRRAICSATMPDIQASSARTILVVEPDPHVRAMAVDALEGEGLYVVEASSAAYAATLLQQRADIRLVFTEAVTPGDLNGFDLARVAQAQDPKIAVIIVAGALPHGFSGVAPDARFLPKPYRMTDVIRLIRESAEDQSHPG